jgi:hypothetical protein
VLANPANVSVTMARSRNTFTDRDVLDVTEPWETDLIYGPESRRVWREVYRQHRVVLRERQESIDYLRPFYRVAHVGRSYGETNRLIARMFPHDWERMSPWRKLARLGYQQLRDAVEQDTKNAIGGS